MRYFSNILIGVSKVLPRGFARVLRLATRLDPALKDYPIHLPALSIPLRADLSESVYISLFRYGDIPHQRGFDQICSSLINEGDNVFDIGANIGYVSALFSDLVGVSGKVISVEPAPNTFRLLKRSLGNVTNITLRNLGIAAKAGELYLTVPTMSDTATFVEGATSGASELVAVISADALAIEVGCEPQLIKIDVEGFEPEVLAGMATLLTATAPPIIIFEALTDVLLRKCIACIKASGSEYTYYRLQNDGSLTPSDYISGSSDFLALPRWAENRCSSLYMSTS